jgi:hypothetical protein
MLIQEMLDKQLEKSELGYDLKDDLVFFMNNDPEFYRKQYYPAMLKFKKYCKEDKRIQSRAFNNLVNDAYDFYKTKFPVEGLDEMLNKETCESICEYILELETKNVKDGHYD